MTIKKLFNWITYERKTIIKPDGKIMVEPEFSTKQGFNPDLWKFSSIECGIVVSNPKYEGYKIGKPRRRVQKTNVLWFFLIIALLTVVIGYGNYLVTNPGGEYSPFVNGAEEYYYEQCQKKGTCSEDVAETLRQIGTLKIKFFEEFTVGDRGFYENGTFAGGISTLNTGGIGDIDKEWIEYIVRFPPDEQKGLAKTFINIKTELTSLENIDKDWLEYISTYSLEEQKEIVEVIINIKSELKELRNMDKEWIEYIATYSPEEQKKLAETIVNIKTELTALSDVDKIWIEYIATYSPEEQKKLAETIVNIKTELTALNDIDKEWIGYIARFPIEEQKELAEIIIKTESRKLSDIDKKWIKLWVEYILISTQEEQKKLTEKLIKDESMTNTGVSAIPVLGGTEDQRKHDKKALEYIELVRPYGYKYLKNVKVIEISDSITACGQAYPLERKIKLRCFSTCTRNYCNNPEALIALIIDEACKVSLTENFEKRNNYNHYKTCREIETFCGKESGTFVFDGVANKYGILDEEILKEYLKRACDEYK